MFLLEDRFDFKYAPILSLSLSEMEALEQLPEKDKNLILPIFPLKGWMSSQLLENSLKKIKKTIGDRKWIAYFDNDYLSGNKNFMLTGAYPREVFNQLVELKKPSNGYNNWYKFLKDIPEAIPTVFLDDLSQLEHQITQLISLNRGLTFVFEVKKLALTSYNEIIDTIFKLKVTDLLFVYDVGTIGNDYNEYYQPLLNLINKTRGVIPFARIAISGTSFPSNFAGYHKGENSIYERLLFNKLKSAVDFYPTIYSDRGSARIEKQSGGGNLPPPRIDYALKNDWRFIRREFNDSKSPEDGEKEHLYSLCATEIMQQDYWSKSLHLWGTQMIELTSKKEKFGINTPQKATAVRINLHLYTQLHYDYVLDEIDTDEDWED
ncbi:beta family protein [Yersinia rohdei]|uniref:beta family protein n=1 Tax=Yersinia rohdei TaxID=29485 RepID=UPI0025AB4DEF|nr:protein beta [Yersinia rohdei]MDN0096332.1 protein beta [Yersinia rohdei]